MQTEEPRPDPIRNTLITDLQDKLVMYVVYNRPRDYPEEFVIRRWFIGPDHDGILAQFMDTQLYARSRTLVGIRAEVPPGMFRMPRYDDDDPAIYETWV
jgi:hypothetical protein